MNTLERIVLLLFGMVLVVAAALAVGDWSARGQGTDWELNAALILNYEKTCGEKLSPDEMRGMEFFFKVRAGIDFNNKRDMEAILIKALRAGALLEKAGDADRKAFCAASREQLDGFADMARKLR